MSHQPLRVSIGREPVYLLEAEGKVVGQDGLASDVYVTAIYHLSEGRVLVDAERELWSPWPSFVDLEIEMYAQKLLFEQLKDARAERMGFRRYRP